MGRDKALLTMPGSDLPLWRRQWQLLEALQPEEIFWSGPPRPGVPENFHIVEDIVPNAGPLAGISACLDLLRADLLVVLAVDLPQMHEVFLRHLLRQCTSESGAVAYRGDFFEPLAAVYPKRLHVLAAEHLAQGCYALQDFIGEAVEQQAIRPVPLAEKDSASLQEPERPFRSFRRRRLRGGPFAGRDPEMDELMLPQDGQARLAIRLAQDQEAMQFVDRAQLLVIQPDEDVVDLHAGLGGGGILFDGVNENAGTLAQLVEAAPPARGWKRPARRRRCNRAGCGLP